ncbi:MAG TPA: hypothetical protein VIY73_17940 [Polyangiaceae bacterium]
MTTKKTPSKVTSIFQRDPKRAYATRPRLTKPKATKGAAPVSPIVLANTMAMTFESAVGYAHRAEQRAPIGGEADAFRAAMRSGEWGDVAYALARIIEAVASKANSTIAWSPADRIPGGVEPNFRMGVERAQRMLDDASSDQGAASAFAAVASLSQALEAMSRKIDGSKEGRK